MPALESLSSFALCVPEARRFRRKYPRIHALPVRELEVDGRDAVVLRFAQIDGPAELAVVLDQQTYRLLRVHDSSPH